MLTKEQSIPPAAIDAHTRLLQSDAYRKMLAEDKHHNPEAFLSVTRQVFEDVQLAGARVLEIGSGRGLISIYLAAHGASVVSLEPELVGSTAGVIETQQRRCAELGVRVETVPADFNTWETDERFDVIVSRASINHLYASEHHAAHHPETFAAYLAVAKRVKRLLKPGGVFVATDGVRYNFWKMARKWVKRPDETARSGVNWRHHQNAGTWGRIFAAAGFQPIALDYHTPHRYRSYRWALNNRVGNFWLGGRFIMKAWNNSDARKPVEAEV